MTRKADTSPTPGQLKALRRRHDLTQQRAADLLAVTLSGYQRWEQGERRMRPGLWRLLRLQLGEPVPPGR